MLLKIDTTRHKKVYINSSMLWIYALTLELETKLNLFGSRLLAKMYDMISLVPSCDLVLDIQKNHTFYSTC